MSFLSMRQLDQLPMAVGYKNIDSVYVMGNARLAQYMGYNSADEIVGLTDYDIRGDTHALASKYIEQDQEVMQTGELQHLDVGVYPTGELQIHLSIKKPWHDDSKQLLGTVFTCVNLPLTFMKHLMLPVIRAHLPLFYAIGGQYRAFDFSPRESECLFYLIRGLSAKAIANRLQISAKTVEYYIHQLKQKMGCLSKSELIETCVSQGFLFNIPMHLFN